MGVDYLHFPLTQPEDSSSISGRIGSDTILHVEWGEKGKKVKRLIKNRVKKTLIKIGGKPLYTLFVTNLVEIFFSVTTIQSALTVLTTLPLVSMWLRRRYQTPANFLCGTARVKWSITWPMECSWVLITPSLLWLMTFGRIQKRYGPV